MAIADFPRVPLAHLPTPLEPLDHLSRFLDGPRIFVKRDDCTGLATGGNKTRKLEFLLADARAKGCDALVTVGATQSNHVRQTIAAAAKSGLQCHVLLEHEVTGDDDYETNGNVLLDRLMGATLHHCDKSPDLNAQGQELANGLRHQGLKPYFIPAGGSNAIGSLGYVACASELLAQANQMKLDMAALITATGSQGTQAGLLVGLALAGRGTPVHGITVSRPASEQAAKVTTLVRQTESLLDAGTLISTDQVLCDDGYFQPGYGLPNDAMVEAVTVCARLEGLLLDPVYSGKAMAGLFGAVRQGTFGRRENIVFLHTGGQAALSAYRSVF